MQKEDELKHVKEKLDLQMKTALDIEKKYQAAIEEKTMLGNVTFNDGSNTIY